MSIRVASLLSEGAQVRDQSVDLILRKLFAEGRHLRFRHSVGDGVRDLVVGGGALPLGGGEVRRLVLPPLLGLAAPVSAVAKRAALRVDLLGGLGLDGRRGRDGNLGEQREDKGDHGVSCARAASASRVWRNATRSWMSCAGRRFSKAGI